jgi:hypothetical protein
MMEIWRYAIPASWNKAPEQGKDPSMTAASSSRATEHESAEAGFRKVSREPTSLQEEETSEEGV